MSIIEQNDFNEFAANANYTERLKEIDKHAFRSEYQRDRDRILYSKEFRRLEGKTQVFASGFDDNMRTRLTHTIEVAQIANTIATYLNLDVMLTEAIAYGHDVGHTPFGHIGERTLNYIMNGCINMYDFNDNMCESDKGFKHNRQGVKVACFLEKYNEDEPGLNLTKHTLWGIENHTKKKYNDCDFFDVGKRICLYKMGIGNKCALGKPLLDYYDQALVYEGKAIIEDRRDWTIEAIVVAIADEIAQRQHDIEDGIYAGVIDTSELITKIYEFLEIEIDINIDSRKSIIISRLSKEIVNLYVNKAIDSLKQVLFNIRHQYLAERQWDFWGNHADIYEKLTDNGKKNIIDVFWFDDGFKKKDKDFQKYLSSRILQTQLAQSMDSKAEYIIKKLFKAYLTNPQQLPDQTIVAIINAYDKDLIKESEPFVVKKCIARGELKDKFAKRDDKLKQVMLRVICDYIAGMTDNYAIRQYEKLYGYKETKKMI